MNEAHDHLVALFKSPLKKPQISQIFLFGNLKTSVFSVAFLVESF